LYCEFFYQSTGSDVDFDPDFSSANAAEACRLRLKNANNLLHLDMADAGLSPTAWQASIFPGSFRRQIPASQNTLSHTVI
jgi:Glycosyl transferase family 4 group